MKAFLIISGDLLADVALVVSHVVVAVGVLMSPVWVPFAVAWLVR